MFSEKNQERVDLNGLRHASNEIINSKHLHDDKMRSILFFCQSCEQISLFTNNGVYICIYNFLKLWHVC